MCKKLFRPDALVLLHHQATKEALRTHAPMYRYVHLATHGCIDQSHPMDSGLRLADDVASLRRLPPSQRAAWRAIFDYYVFDAGVDPAGHIPPHKHGVLGDMPDAHADQVRAFLVGKLQQR